ncbi:hypothetical protein MTO96_050078, partial [Rhipicephalus appendiculatus]
MLEIVIQEPMRQRTRAAQVIDWYLFRAQRKQQAAPPTITNINTWTTELVKQVADATQTVDVEDPVPYCDRYYAHLWKRKKSLEALLSTRKWDRGRRAPKALPEMNLQVQGNPIPRTDHIRILGLHLQANGSNTISLQRIYQSVVQIARLLKRVSNKHQGMRESNLPRLVQAFICSRITYSAPYLRLTRAESERLETTLRKAYKTALGLPMSTATHKLMA